MRRLPHHLVVFVKAPVLGRVKTRLARDIGWTAATGFYRQTTETVLRRLARDPRWTIHLAVTPDRDRFRKGLWLPRLARLPQKGGDLGRRMHRPMTTLPPGPVVIIGTDVPGIRAAHIAAAFRALGRCDAVFGPASDGGYWLVGLKRRPKVIDIFRDVRWSTEHALQDTIANVPVGWRMGLLPTLDDVDDGAAYRRVKKRSR